MQAVVRAQRPWGLLPDPSSSFWPGAITTTSDSLPPAPAAAAFCSTFCSAVSASPSPTCSLNDATKTHRRIVLKPLCATAGDGSDWRGATMPEMAAAPDETGSERLAAVRNLERALDPAAAEAAELRRRHKEAVELARTGDPETALACLHSLLVNAERLPLCWTRVPPCVARTQHGRACCFPGLQAVQPAGPPVHILQSEAYTTVV